MELQSLIHKYWAGETTREEEQQLRQLLREPAHARAFPKEAMLFQLFDHESAIERPAAQEHLPHRRRNLRPLWISLAASIALLLGLYWGNRSENPLPKPDSVNQLAQIEDPDQAYEVTREALLLVSQQLNRSKKPHQQVSKLQLLTRWLPNDKAQE